MTATAHQTASCPPEQEAFDALIVREVPWQDPLTAFAPFASDPVAALLHSDGLGERGRYSYIAVSPFQSVRTGVTLQSSVDDQAVDGNPFDVLETVLSQHRVNVSDAPVPFAGGAVGFISYEVGRSVERLPQPRAGATNPAMVVGLYDVVAAFDHESEQAWVIASGLPETEPEARQVRAIYRANWLSEKISQARRSDATYGEGQWTPELSRQAVERGIAKALDYIRAGDIYQANITQRFSAPRPAVCTPFDLFRRLREHAPSPFGAYISGGIDFHLLSASPERFLRVDSNGIVETRPIKGTRPRGQTREADDALAADLQNSAKDQAENLMIVDLMRNDLSRVCVPGSVTVPVLSGLETYPTIHHLVSSVTGRLQSGRSAIDVLRACFPGGSVTGAPKIRAMEIIHEIEPAARGPYCGAVLWAGFDGAMDSSIVIRSLVVDGDTVIAQAGGGIVADSDPAQEYEEALTKMKPLLSVLTPERAR